MNRFDATFLAGIHCFCNLFAFDTFFPGDIWGPLPAVFVLPQCWFCFLYFFFIFCWHWYCWMPFIFDGRHWYAIRVKCEMDVEIYLSTVSRFLLPVWFLQLLSPDQGVVVGRHILNWDFELGARSIAFEGTLLFFRGVIIIDMLSSPVPGVVVGRHIPPHRRLLLGFQHKIVLPGFFFTFTFSRPNSLNTVFHFHFFLKKDCSSRFPFTFTFSSPKGWLANAKLKPLSLFISLLSMPKKAFDHVKIEKWKVKVVSALH